MLLFLKLHRCVSEGLQRGRHMHYNCSHLFGCFGILCTPGGEDSEDLEDKVRASATPCAKFFAERLTKPYVRFRIKIWWVCGASLCS